MTFPIGSMELVYLFTCTININHACSKIYHSHWSYCWWFRNPAPVEVGTFLHYWVLYIPGGCFKFLPSTAWLPFFTPTFHFAASCSFFVVFSVLGAQGNSSIFLIGVSLLSRVSCSPLMVVNPLKMSKHGRMIDDCCSYYYYDYLLYHHYVYFCWNKIYHSNKTTQ